MKYINKVFTPVIIVQQTKNIKNKKQNLNVEKKYQSQKFLQSLSFSNTITKKMRDF